MINKIKVVAFLVYLLFVIKLAGDLDNTYTFDALVVSSVNDEIVLKDWKDTLWSYHSDDTYKVGDKLKVKFHTNYTPHNRSDDYIIKIKKEEAK